MKSLFLLVGLLMCIFGGSSCRPVAAPETATLSPAVPNKVLPPNAPAPAATIKVAGISGMTATRASHTATLLTNGQVLITGGFGDGEQALSSVELYDPAARSFKAIAPMGVARLSHTATRLLDGRVLIAGGYNGQYLRSAELFDPATGVFSPTGPLLTARSEHVAVLLQNGSVLVIGGVGDNWTFLDSAEVFDPATGTFSAVGSMMTPRESHTATVLQDGRVLVTGGHQGRRSAIMLYTSAEIFDPATNTFAPAGDMNVRRHKHDATLLLDGRVLITGGSDERDDQGAYRSAELYDPVLGRFVMTAPMQAARYKHRGTSLVLADGRVLVLGGAPGTELYDSADGVFQLASDSVGEARLFATATLLPNGEVLFAGGYGPHVSVSAQAWVVTP